MKKAIIFLVIIIGLFATIAIVTKVQQKQLTEGNAYQKDDLHPATIDLLDDPLYANIILPKSLKEKLQNSEDVTVYFFSPTCGYCMQTTPVLNPVAEKMGVDVVQYNLLEFDGDEYNIESTPTLVHFKDGKESARIVGYHPAEDFEAWFKDNVQ